MFTAQHNIGWLVGQYYKRRSYKIESFLPLIFTRPALSTSCFDWLLFPVLLCHKLSLVVARNAGGDDMPLLEARYLLQVFHDLLLIFLHLDHFLPLPLSHISNLSNGHYAHLLDVMINLFFVQRLLLNLHRPFSISLTSTLHKLPQLSGSLFCYHDIPVLLIKEVDSLVGLSHSEAIFAHVHSYYNE